MDGEARYGALLLDWNRRINLTGARTQTEVQAQLADAHRLLEIPWDGVGSVVDIGSGGGLPAIPLALALPLVRFTLIEANARKAAFLQHAAGELQLHNVAIATARAETLAHQAAYRESFDRAISRAAARPPVLLELALPFVRLGGDLAAEVGDIDAGPLLRIADLLGGSNLRIEPARSGGALLRVDKQRASPARFPRRPGPLQRRPLA